MSTHSITHSITHRPAAFVAAGAMVAAIAVGAVVVSQNDNGSSAQQTPTVQTPPLKHYPPLHGGTTKLGQP